nr:aminopeptidase P family N-terminal domain-containing protein [Psychrobacillus sp.]
MSNLFDVRRTILKHYLVEQAIDAVMITDPSDVFYYTGFNSNPHELFMSLIINTQNNMSSLFVPALDKDVAIQAADIEHIIPISDEQNPFDVVSNTIGAFQGIMGIEGKALSYFRYQSLLKVFPSIQVVDVQPFIIKQRMKKSIEEISYLKKALEIIEKVLEEGIKKVVVGMTEAELTAELEF